MAKRILVAEDDPDNRCIVVKVLTLEGYQTVATDDGRSALALARRERPDLIVMDLGMPGMDGWEAARRLKADPQTADIPIIALTAWDEEPARRDARRDTMAISRNPVGRRPSARPPRASSPAAERRGRR